MSSTWDSLVAERVVSMLSSLACLTATVPSLPDLTADKKQRLCASHSCFNCCLSPGDPKWMAHPGGNCPGDPTRNITPCACCVPPTGVAAVIAPPLEHAVTSIRFVDTNVLITFTDIDDSLLPFVGSSVLVASVCPLSSGADDIWSDSDNGGFGDSD